MTKLLFIFPLNIIFLCGVAIPSSAANDCTGIAALSCARNLQQISEQPAGLIDGKNDIFTLSKQPANNHAVRLFVNDVELARIVAFRVNGQNVLIRAASIPQPGDMLRASFEAMAIATGEKTRAAIPLSKRNGILAQQALLELVLSEEAALAPPTFSQAAAPEVPSYRTRRDRPYANNSFSLLARRINEQARASVHENRKQIDSADGFEGIGDVPVLGPYSELLQIRPSNVTGLFSDNTGAGGRSSRSTRRSIKMLEQRLDSSPNNEIEGTGEAAR